MKKILVFDDKQENLDMAILQLKDVYEIITEKDIDAAMEIIEFGKFDILLTDCFIPVKDSDGWTDEHKKLIGQEMPAGLVLAILALKKGVPEIIIVSDTRYRHHYHPISFLMDSVWGSGQIAVDCKLTEDQFGKSVKDWKAVLDNFLQSNY